MRKLFTLLFITLLSTPIMAAESGISSDTISTQTERRMISPGTPFFVPHWYIKAQGGVAYDVGEASFSQLLSPAFQLSTGYQFNDYVGIRGNLGGLWAKNRYAYPAVKYSWNFLQVDLGAQVNLTSLILGSDPERRTQAYAFAGLGVNYTFNNEDAVEANKNVFGVNFQKLWDNHRWNPVVKVGLGLDYFVTDNIAIGAEVNGNMLPDHFNSKLGKRDNKDWHFNALVGVKFTFGNRSGRTEPVYEEPAPVVEAPAPPEIVDVPIEKISFNVNIQFIINQSVIRSNQIPKLRRLLNYLGKHPRAFIRLSGYADRDTGTPEINMRLSQERAQVVSQYLIDAGIQEWRIRRFAKGDRVQPFDIPSDNRVCICFVYDPDNPVPLTDW